MHANKNSCTTQSEKYSFAMWWKVLPVPVNQHKKGLSTGWDRWGRGAHTFAGLAGPHLEGWALALKILWDRDRTQDVRGAVKAKEIKGTPWDIKLMKRKPCSHL